MRVLVSAQAEEVAEATQVASSLAGSSGETLSLGGLGIRSLYRRQSQAEVHVVRKALLGLAPGDELRPRPASDRVVGYVCRGRSLDRQTATAVVAVSDHVNLTWRSPLEGANDRALGPRFPVVAGLYEPDLVVGRLGGTTGEAVAHAVVAQVARAEEPSLFERDTLAALGVEVVSEELVPVVLLAAHLGFRVAAAVVLEETANRAR